MITGFPLIPRWLFKQPVLLLSKLLSCSRVEETMNADYRKSENHLYLFFSSEWPQTPSCTAPHHIFTGLLTRTADSNVSPSASTIWRTRIAPSAAASSQVRLILLCQNGLGCLPLTAHDCVSVLGGRYYETNDLQT